MYLESCKYNQSSANVRLTLTETRSAPPTLWLPFRPKRASSFYRSERNVSFTCFLAALQIGGRIPDMQAGYIHSFPFCFASRCIRCTVVDQAIHADTFYNAVRSLK